MDAVVAIGARGAAGAGMLAAAKEVVGVPVALENRDSEPYIHEVVLYDKVTNCQFNANWLTIILNYLNLPKQKMNLKLSKINGCMQ